MKENKEEKLEETILDLEQYVQMMGEDMFNITIINSLKDYRAYVNERKRKNDELNRFYREIDNRDYDGGMVCESFPEFATRKRKTPTLSLSTILKYAENLTSPEDVKTIQLMLFKLIGRKCSEEQYEQIGELECKKDEKPQIAHADQVVVENKGKTAYYSYGKEK